LSREFIEHRIVGVAGVWELRNTNHRVGVEKRGHHVETTASHYGSSVAKSVSRVGGVMIRES
jgi:hypothetical protein